MRNETEHAITRCIVFTVGIFASNSSGAVLICLVAALFWLGFAVMAHKEAGREQS